MAGNAICQLLDLRAEILSEAKAVQRERRKNRQYPVLISRLILPPSAVPGLQQHLPPDSWIAAGFAALRYEQRH